MPGTFRPHPSSSPMPRYFFDFWEDGNLIADDEVWMCRISKRHKMKLSLPCGSDERDLPAGGSHELKLILRDENGEQLLELA